MRNILDIFKPSGRQWLMSPTERALLCGLAAVLQPRSILEIGVFEGAASIQLAKLTPSIKCVDIQDRFIRPLPSNMELIIQSSDTFFRSCRPEDIWDLIVLDADHHIKPSYLDLLNCIAHGRVIVVHDSTNMECRLGYENALIDCKDRILYSNLNLAQGNCVIDNVRWGGIGIVITKDYTWETQPTIS
jgi:hypothetical protein